MVRRSRRGDRHDLPIAARRPQSAVRWSIELGLLALLYAGYMAARAAMGVHVTAAVSAGSRSSTWRRWPIWTSSGRSTRYSPPSAAWPALRLSLRHACTTSSRPPSWCGSRSAGARLPAGRATRCWWRPRSAGRLLAAPHGAAAAARCGLHRHHGRVQRRGLVGSGRQRASGHGGAEQPVRGAALAARRVGGVGGAVPRSHSDSALLRRWVWAYPAADDRRRDGHGQPLPRRCACRHRLRVRRLLARAESGPMESDPPRPVRPARRRSPGGGVRRCRSSRRGW